MIMCGSESSGRLAVAVDRSAFAGHGCRGGRAESDCRLDAADAPAGRARRHRWRQDPARRQPPRAAAFRSSTRPHERSWPSTMSAAVWPTSPTLPGGRYLLAVDQAANELLLIDIARPVDSSRRPDQGQPRPGSARRVDRWFVLCRGFPLVAPADVRRAGATGVGRSSRPRSRFSARSTCRSARASWPWSADGSKLIVADAFGGRLAVVDTKRRAIDSVRSLPAHNIRGLAFAPDGQTLVVAHQVLNPLAQTSFDDVHWGLLDPQSSAGLADRAFAEAGSDAALLDGSRLFDLGDVGYAAGDPADVAFDARGNLLVALAGVDEVAITASPDQAPRRIVVGRRPTAVVPSPDGLLGLCRRQSGRHDLRRRDRDRAPPGDDLSRAST